MLGLFSQYFSSKLWSSKLLSTLASLATLTPSAGRDLVCCFKKVQYPLGEEIYASVFTLKSMMIDKELLDQQELVFCILI